MTNERDVARIARALVKAGWTSRPMQKGGVMLYPSDGGEPIVLHTSMRGGTVVRLRKQMRAAGVDEKVLRQLG